MPSFIVKLDDNVLATVSCEGFDVATVSVSGTRIEEDFCNLRLSAGRYPEGEESTYLTWLNEHPLKPKQRVSVAFLQDGATSFPGKTIDELFPDEETATPTEEFKSEHELFDELRRKPNLRDRYSFEYHSTTGTAYTGATSAETYGFAFTVLWNWLRPERVSVSLHSFTIDSVEQRQPGSDHVREYLHIGQSATIEIAA